MCAAHRLGFREAGASARNVGFGHSALLEAAMATGQAGFEVAWSFMHVELRCKASMTPIEGCCFG